MVENNQRLQFVLVDGSLSSRPRRDRPWRIKRTQSPRKPIGTSSTFVKSDKSSKAHSVKGRRSNETEIPGSSMVSDKNPRLRKQTYHPTFSPSVDQILGVTFIDPFSSLHEVPIPLPILGHITSYGKLDLSWGWAPLSIGRLRRSFSLFRERSPDMRS
jgi:hypothetical protein